MAIKMKFELGVDALKKMALFEYNMTMFDDDLDAYWQMDEVEAYFYINEQGQPVFVIEECT